jgi:hypothetical protein
MIVPKAKALIFVTALVLVLLSTSASAATSPKITWKVTSLRPSTSVSILTLASSNSNGVKSWSVSGACSLKKGKLTTKSRGVCVVRLSIKSKGKFASRTVSKRFDVKQPKSSTVTTVTTVAPWVPATTRVTAASQCMLPDRRDVTLINAPRSLGFPLNQTGSKAIGTINLVLVAADFPNFEGKAGEIEKLEEQIRRFDAWLAFQSNGRLKAAWQFPKKFFRMPQMAADYGVVGFTVSTHVALVSDVVATADPDVDFTSVDEMFVYMPDSLTDSEPGRNPFDGILSQFGGTDVRTPEGIIKHVKGSGTVSKQIQYGIPPTLWALWAHDLLHAIGVEGHNPDKSATLESEDYLNLVMSSWNQWLLGWMTNEQIACIDKSSANGMDVDLVPLQSSAGGFRTAIMPLSETRAIVVESHRNTGYGENFGASGVLAYLMDTKNVQPYADRDKTALIGSKFLDPNTVVTGARNRIGKGQNSSLMIPGEYAEFETVRVEFVRSGDLDKIRFTVSG